MDKSLTSILPSNRESFNSIIKKFKLKKISRAIFVLFTICAVLSCKSDDREKDQAKDLVGKWQRSDYSDEYEYKLIFNPDNTGYKEEREGSIEMGQATSSLTTFNWKSNNTILTIDYGGEVITTNYSINANGHLLLIDVSNLHFIKLE